MRLVGRGAEAALSVGFVILIVPFEPHETIGSIKGLSPVNGRPVLGPPSRGRGPGRGSDANATAPTIPHHTAHITRALIIAQAEGLSTARGLVRHVV